MGGWERERVVEKGIWNTIINYFIDYTDNTDTCLILYFVESFINNTICFTTSVLRNISALVEVLSTEFGTC